MSSTKWVILHGLNDHESYSDPTVYGTYDNESLARAAATEAFGDYDECLESEKGDQWEVVSLANLNTN